MKNNEMRRETTTTTERTMKKSHTIYTILLLALLLLLALPLIGHGGANGMGNGKGSGIMNNSMHGQAHRSGCNNATMGKGMNLPLEYALTATQQKEMVLLRNEHREEMMPLMQKLHALPQGESDESKELLAEITTLRTQHRDDMKSILTKEQWTYLEKNRNTMERGSCRGMINGNGMGRGMGNGMMNNSLQK